MTNAKRPAMALATLLLLVAAPHAVKAEDADFQSWTQIQTTLRLPHALDVTLDGTVRRGATASQRPDGSVPRPTTALFVRPSFGYAVNEHLHLALGYAWAPVFRDGEGAAIDVDEHRVFEQVSVKGAIGPVRITVRTRLEERMRDHGAGRGDVALRLRERVHLEVPFRSRDRVRFVVADELLFALDRTRFPSAPGLSENRAFVGFAHHAATGSMIEVGYLHDRTVGRSHATHHVLYVSLRFDVHGAGRVRP